MPFLPSFRIVPEARTLLTGLAALCLTSLPILANAQTPAWMGYGRDAQHTAISSFAAQPLNRIRWQTPVDLQPQYSGDNLLVHYGSPVVTQNNTVIFPVKTGPNDGFRIEARRGSDGRLVWQMATGYLLPPHNWTPSVGVTLTPTGRLYFPGFGGTVTFRQDASSPTSPTGSFVFYGKDKLYQDIATYRKSVFISTPITSDVDGNIYFGYVVTGATPINLKSGLARISPNGKAIYITAPVAANDGNVTQFAMNSAPALSNDGKTLYAAVRTPGSTGYLLAMNSQTLQTTSRVRLVNPLNGGNTFILNDGTSSPTVGPDGDVYFGTWNGGETHYRGWLLHFSADLKTTKIAGGFGWDDTAGIVPATMVPSYKGKSSYLLMTKYNNYAEGGGDGVNKLALLDPNDTQLSSINGATVMKEILTIVGPTPDIEFVEGGLPNAVREWCINTAAIDPATKSILVNNEDGKAYRWDITTNKLVQTMTLTPGIGEAYTPTIIGPDGTVYAINNAILFALGK